MNHYLEEYLVDGASNREDAIERCIKYWSDSNYFEKWDAWEIGSQVYCVTCLSWVKQ
jgi:hypothetical protein